MFSFLGITQNNYCSCYCIKFIPFWKVLGLIRQLPGNQMPSKSKKLSDREAIWQNLSHVDPVDVHKTHIEYIYRLVDVVRLTDLSLPVVVAAAAKSATASSSVSNSTFNNDVVSPDRANRGPGSQPNTPTQVLKVVLHNLNTPTTPSPKRPNIHCKNSPTAVHGGSPVAAVSPQRVKRLSFNATTSTSHDDDHENELKIDTDTATSLLDKGRASVIDTPITTSVRAVKHNIKSPKKSICHSNEAQPEEALENEMSRPNLHSKCR